jgi:hypothetical protein
MFGCISSLDASPDAAKPARRPEGIFQSKEISVKHSLIRSAGRVALVALFLGVAPPCAAQMFVEPRAVVAAPQRFWAKEIAVQDRLIELPGRDTQNINDRRYFSFRTATMGLCYADPECAEKLRGLRLQQDYLFVGTVLERRGRYYIAFRSVDPLIRDPESVVNLVGRGITPELERHRLVEQIARTMDQAEGRLLVYVRQARVDPKEMFNPDGPHYDATLRIIADAIVAEEREGRMSATEVLTRAIRDRFAAHYLGPNARSLEENIPAEMLRQINTIVPPPLAGTPQPAPPPQSPVPAPTLPLQIEQPGPAIAATDGQQPPPEDSGQPNPPVILGNEPDDVLERMLADAEKAPNGEAANAPPVVIAPEAPPPGPPVVVIPEPVPPVVVLPVPEPEPPPPEPPVVVIPEPVPPVVVLPVPEPEPPPPEPPVVVMPEPVPPVVVLPIPEPEPLPPEPPVVVMPEPIPPAVVLPIPEPEPPPPEPPVVVMPEPVPPVVVLPEPEPEPLPPEPPVVVMPEPVPPAVVLPIPDPEPPPPEPPVVVMPEPVPPVVVLPEPEPEPAPTRPAPSVVVVPAPAQPKIKPLPETTTPPPVIVPEPEPEPTPPPVVRPSPPAPVTPLPPAPPPVVRPTKPPQTPPAPKPLPPLPGKEPVTPTPPKPAAPKEGDKPGEEEGIYDPDVDFHFKHLNIKPR